ncbi:hypothetical protein ABZP36_031580 [Zizania latifolia]
MLEVLFLPTLLYLIVTVCYLPESPHWLVSKDRMKKARAMLQMLRGRHWDISVEMALLVEGLSIGRDTAIEEYVVDLSEDNWTIASGTGQLAWQCRLAGGGASRHGSVVDHLRPQDHVVTLLNSLHDMKALANDASSSTLFPNLGSLISGPIDWDEETGCGDQVDEDDDDGIEAPLLGVRIRRHSSLMTDMDDEATTTRGIGGGWQLVWKWMEGIAAGCDRAW